MAEEKQFKVFLQNVAAFSEEWKRVLNAPASELPKLNASEKAFARKWGIAEEDYQRMILHAQYKEERVRSRSRELGKIAEEVVTGLGPDYGLAAVIAEMQKDRWMLRFQTPQGIRHVVVPRDLGDELVDWGTLEDKERLRVLLLQGLGREELIGNGR